MQHNDMWDGVFTHIKHTMHSRQATHAVLYVLTRDKKPHLLPIHAYDTAETASDLSRSDNIKYIAFILVTSEGGQPASEFYPIYPLVQWPNEIVQDIVHQAHQVM
jgi:hypothetical protein